MEGTQGHSCTSTFSAFGLRVDSSLPCPELPASPGPTDVRIRFGSVPSRLAKVEAQGVRFQADRSSFLLFRDGVAGRRCPN